MKSENENKLILENAYIELENERQKTRENMSRDIYKISKALCEMKELSFEGQTIRDDLLGLLEFESDCIHQVDALMIDRRKQETKENTFSFKMVQKIQ